MDGPENALPLPKSADKFRADIEGLRGVAVLLVVGCHCGISWCAGGFVGVDIFFVISGYLITDLLTREYLKTSRIDFGEFFARRARRLLPVFVVVLASTALTAAWFLGPQDIVSTARAAIAASLYVSNIFFDHASSDYFAPAVQRNPLLHTWSLGVEEQVYLVWPCLILFTRRSSRFRPGVWIMGAVAVGSFACSLLATRDAPTFAFFELPARAWEFAGGGILALATAIPFPRTRNWALAGGIGGAAMILGTVIWLKGGSGFPGWIALFPVTGTLLVLLAGAMAPHQGVSAVLGTAPLQFLGARSYSWYLWHWPFVVFAEVLLPPMSIADKIAAGIAALLMAALTYRYVERPIRTNQYLARRRNLSLSTAAGVACLTAGASTALASFGYFQVTLDARFKSIQAATVDYGFAARECYVDGSTEQAFEAKVCEFGDPRAAQTVVLFGDSHAMQWINAMRKVADAKGWRLATLVKPGCAASDINPHNLAVPSDRCKVWRARAIEKIIELAPLAVVMASYNGATFAGDMPLMPVDEVRSGTRSTLQRLTAAGIAVVVLRDSPIPPFNVPACIARAVGKSDARADSCNFNASRALNPSAFEAERAAAEGLTDVHYLDLDDLICPAAACATVQNGRIIYRDDNHLAGSYAESLAGEMATRLSRVLDSAPALAQRAGEITARPACTHYQPP
jgi:peptidoglycan/LPS O-acetylase OafA/YrhL